MKIKRIAINGFGRIGRAAFKIALEKKDVEIVAINDLVSADILAHLLRYDTVYGRYAKEVSAREGILIVDGKEFPVYAESDPKKLSWKKLNVDVVLECTGRFTDKKSAEGHIDAGARKVILSAPSKGESDAVPTFLIGVNEADYKNQDIISNASCTTHSLAAIAKIFDETFGVEKALMTTIHSYTADQNLQDGPHKDLRRARAAGQNIVPTTTGAAISVTEVLPQLKEKFDGLSIRVPTIVVSLSDLTVILKRKTTKEEINQTLKDASVDARYRQVLAVTEAPLVSSDFIGNPYSGIVDLAMTKVVDGDLVKVIVWYDNEWGYSNRLVELAQLVV